MSNLLTFNYVTMTFSESIKTCLAEKYANFSGDASLSEFNWFLFFLILFFFFCLFCTQVFTIEGTLGTILGILFIIIWLLLFIPSLAVASRRLNDGGFSGWLLLLILLGPLGWSILIILFQKPSINK